MRARLASGVLLAAVIIPVALTRIVDGDEGFYLIAGQQVAQGSIPYRDFFFLQAPGTPYLFAVWMWMFGETWLAARCLGALLAIGTGLLVHVMVERRTGSRGTALLAAACYGTTGLALAWLPLAKTYGVTALCLMGACALLDHTDPPRWRLIAGGALAGFAVLCRLPAIVAVPILIVFCPSRRRLIDRGALIAFGSLIALAPAMAIATRDLGAYWFGNVGFHSLRSDAGLVGDLGQKGAVLGELAGLGPGSVGTGPQFLVLSVGAAVAAVLALRAGQRPPLTIPVAAGLFLIMLAPTPTYAQYQSVTVPLLAVAAGDLVRPVARVLRERVWVWGAIVALAWVLSSATALRPNLWEGPDELQLASVRRVSSDLDAIAGRGEPILSLWPGYLLEADAVPVPGLENQFAIQVSQALTDQTARRFRLMTLDDLREALRRDTIRLVMRGGPGDSLLPGGEMELGWIDSGYRLVGRTSGVDVYANDSAPPP